MLRDNLVGAFFAIDVTEMIDREANRAALLAGRPGLNLPQVVVVARTSRGEIGVARVVGAMYFLDGCAHRFECLHSGLG